MWCVCHETYHTQYVCLMANTPYDSWQTHHVTHVNKSQAKGAAAIKECSYGVATISRLLQIIGLFCKRALYKRLFCKRDL